MWILPLGSHKYSLSIYRRSSPFHQVFAQVLLKWHFRVFPKYSNLYIDGIRVYTTFDWTLTMGTSRSDKTLSASLSSFDFHENLFEVRFVT